MPKLTIGLPVYNGAGLLRRSLDNLLSQTFRDFVLVISDNASSDETANICSEYVRRDVRVQYFRQKQNLVWNENFRSVLARANSPYFMWATHDDIWFPRFAEANIRNLEANPKAVCSVSKIIYYDSNGNERLAPDLAPLTGSPSRRLRDFFLRMDSCGRLYGVYRTELLQKSFPPDLRMFAADWLVVALTLLYGDHLMVDEVLLKREAQPQGYYIQEFGTIDRFDPSPIESYLPLKRLRAELRHKLPPEVWRRVRWPLRYLDLRMLAQVFAKQAPDLVRFLDPIRSGLASVLHKRWQS